MTTVRRMTRPNCAWLYCLATACFFAVGAGCETRGTEARSLDTARKRERETPFSTLMAEEALPIDQLPKMVKDHPRMLIRTARWSGGISLDQLRERARRAPWAKQVAIYSKTPPPQPGYTTLRALLYLETRDESLVPMIVERVMAAKPAYNCGGGLVQTAIWYDWIYDSPSVTDKQRRQMADHIADLGKSAAAILESWFAYDIWTHRAAPGWAADVLAAGLVLDDDHPDAKTLRAWGMGYFKKNFFRGWQHNDGCWLHGGAAYNVAFIVMPTVIACWASATEEDVYGTIRRDYGDWLENHMYFQMAEALPDRTRSEAIAWDHEMGPSCRAYKFLPNYMMIARGCKNPDGYAWLRSIGQDPRFGYYNEMIRILLYDEETDAKRPTLPLASPWSKLWGRHGPGYVQIRSKGWAKDSTVIEFKCGDFVWTHTHVNHSNSFCIYHKGRLAVQSGTYAASDYSRHGHYAYAGNFGSHYFGRSISGNTMLIYQPGEFTFAAAATEDREEPGVIPEPGGQRMQIAIGQTCFTFDEYMRRKTEKNPTEELFETGDIAAFEHAPDYSYTYVCGDATAAYNNPHFCYGYKGRINKPKIDMVTRSLAWLDNKYLVMFDRVNSLDPSYRKAWLCHFQGMPQINGKLIRSEVPGHIEDFDGDLVQMTWADGMHRPPDPTDPGRLFIKTFLPKAHYTRRIGGDGYEFWSNGKNRVYENLKESPKDDKGRWRIEISPAEPANFDVFLNLLYPTDTRVDDMPSAKMIASEGDAMVGLSVGGWAAMFGRKGQVSGPVQYTAPAGKTEHLVADLPRGAKYTLNSGEGRPQELTVSAEGTVRFATHQAGSVKLTPLK
jgi:hypothetical protein